MSKVYSKILIMVSLALLPILSFGQTPNATSLSLGKDSSTPIHHCEATWESLNQRGYPQWFSDAKLGIFIHWGLYSVPALAGREGYGEWFYRGLMAGDTNRAKLIERLSGKRGSTPLEQYAALTHLWKGEYWQPDSWAKLFQQAGAQYVILVTKHHDGYCLWDWDRPILPDWTSVKSGPRRDIVKDFSDAVRRQGLRLGLYYSLAEWTNPLYIWTETPADSVSRYVEQYMIPQFKDLVTKFSPELIFTDGDWDNSAEQWHTKELISWYYNTVGDEAIVNNRWGNGNHHGYKTPEYSEGIVDTTSPWAECRGLGRSFGINHNEPLSNYLTSEELISHFAKLVAGGGGLTLNVGPEADGRISLIQQERLLDLGQWLKRNGEAIYKSHPCTIPLEYGESRYNRIDSIIDFNWVRNAPIRGMTYDHFHIEWEGTVTPRFDETYTLSLDADDKATIILDDDTLITATQKNSTKDIRLKKGQPYRVKVVYEEESQDAHIHLFWSSKSQTLSPIAADHGFKATYSCRPAQVAYTRQGSTLYAILLNPPLQEVSLRAALENYTALTHSPSIHHINLIGNEGDLTWNIRDRELVIQVDWTSPRLFEVKGPWVFRIE